MKKFYFITTMCLLIVLLVGCADNSGNQKNPNSNQNKVSADGWISAAQSIYNKIDLGSSKDDVKKILGEPDKSDEREGTTYDDEKYTIYTWNYSLKDCLKGEAKDTYYDRFDDYITYGVNFTFEDDDLVDKEIYLSSSDSIDVYLGQELNTKVEDLNDLYNKLEEGMKLSEVEEILGTAYFEVEQQKDYDGSVETTYTWYDKKENSLSIDFDKNNRAQYIFDIFEF